MREIATNFSFTSKGAYDHLVALEKKGVISRNPKISRSIIIKNLNNINYLEENRKLKIRIAALKSENIKLKSELKDNKYVF